MLAIASLFRFNVDRVRQHDRTHVQSSFFHITGWFLGGFEVGLQVVFGGFFGDFVGNFCPVVVHFFSEA